MKTIAISIDEAMLEAVDEFSADTARSAAGPKTNRSAVIRRAIGLLLEQEGRRQHEDEDARIFKARRDQLARQAEALVREQAKL